MRADGGSPPTRRVLGVSRGLGCISASTRRVSGLLRLSGLEHSYPYLVYYYAHYSPVVDSWGGCTTGWDLPAQQLPTSRHGITAGRPHRTEEPSSCQPPATLPTRRYSGLSPYRTTTCTAGPGSLSRVGRHAVTSAGACRTRKHSHLPVVLVTRWPFRVLSFHRVRRSNMFTGASCRSG